MKIKYSKALSNNFIYKELDIQYNISKNISIPDLYVVFQYIRFDNTY